MSTQAMTPMRLPLLAAGIAAILISGIAGSLALFAGDGNADVAPAPEAAVPADAPARIYRCAECGVIDSTREIEAPRETAAAGATATPGRDQRAAKTPSKIYQTVVRRPDGSLLVIDDVSPGTWRRGERVKLIGGIESPGT